MEFVSKRRPVPRTFIVVHPETKQEAFVRIQERVARKNLETLRKYAHLGDEALLVESLPTPPRQHASASQTERSIPGIDSVMSL